MSYSFDGKVTNQEPDIKNYDSAKTSCSKCGKLINAPNLEYLLINKKVYTVSSYLDTDHFIYETKKGTAAVYCSDYCRKKHNHRFKK